MTDVIRDQGVVVTRANGGTGRPGVLEFARRRSRIVLLVRGEAGLDGTRTEIETFDGEAFAIPTEVADFAQVEQAADEIEERLGEIDVGVYIDFASIFVDRAAALARTRRPFTKPPTRHGGASRGGR